MRTPYDWFSLPLFPNIIIPLRLMNLAAGMRARSTFYAHVLTQKTALFEIII